MRCHVRIGIIGGSGLEQLRGVKEVRHQGVKTPYGQVRVTRGVIGNAEIFFVSRHLPGHVLSPSKVNYAGNIFALKLMGVEAIIALTTVGSLRRDIKPGIFVVVDQLIDRTRGRRVESFFAEKGLVAHIGFAEPICEELAKIVRQVAVSCTGVRRVRRRGTEVVMEGPAFSTQAESRCNRRDGGDVIGMTVLPEAKFAREAEIPYVVLAVVTDYDAGVVRGTKAVDAVAVGREFAKNSSLALRIILGVVNVLGARVKPPDCACTKALDTAIMTHPGHISSEWRKSPLLARYWRARKEK